MFTMKTGLNDMKTISHVSLLTGGLYSAIEQSKNVQISPVLIGMGKPRIVKVNFCVGRYAEKAVL